MQRCRRKRGHAAAAAASAGARRLAGAWLALLLASAPGAAAPGGAAPDAASSFVGAFAAAQAPSVSAFAAMRAAHERALPAALARAGVVYAGGAGQARLHAALQKLLRGERVRLGVVGGSISAGHGARNGCVPATQSEFVSMCLDKFVSRDADVVFVEFTANDGYVDGSVNNALAHAFERLLRKLLSLPGRPAVVVMNSLQTGAKARGLAFYETSEDHYGVLAQYYGLPWLSVRAAVWQGLMAGWPGFGVADFFLAGEAEQRHPNERGHAYMADLAITLLQQAYADMMLGPPGGDEPPGGLPAPMFPGNWEGANLACVTGADFKAAVEAGHADWYFVNEGSVHKPKWGYVSHVVNATLVLRLDTRAVGAAPPPRLTALQKVELLQRHGMFGAAAALQGDAGAAGGPVDGMAAALAEAERQAAAAADMLARGERPWFGPGGERLVGAQGARGRVELPADAREAVGATTTATGVEVVVGRRRLAGEAGGQQAQQQEAVGGGAAPHAVPPPLDAVHLRPRSSATPLGARGNSVAQADMLVRGAAPRRQLRHAGGCRAATTPLTRAAAVRAHAQVWVGYLKTYRMMGAARLWCVSGCRCTPIVLDGWHEQRTSQQTMARLRVTQSAECRVGVTVLPATRSGHHKFKVSSAMVSKAVPYSGYGDFTATTILGAIGD
ncbi:hypothetical protein HT031_005872 [Scenedesmus sp. PABB004]|nr:hypothetical protein HT031_005872 [Scenedesmus sp. PABB004]